MNPLAKKRAKAILIDTVISNAVSLAFEPLLRKKVKNEMFIVVVAPTLYLWGLEYAQLRLGGQTVGQKMAGIEVESEEGGKLTSEQILKRVVHRDLASSFIYLADRKKYDAFGGEKFPHDIYSRTFVKEV
ncbi:RDD family protein [Planococcus sp. N028]|uniref:RDD family protein n=1 Tax=Planococcus shixiaomingii TaxID=3058393 RepID=A0ABT8N328_9BACL|nr:MULTISPECIES: RDD family protein [unclassified Planococcus (in: firmicutes)]MDN7242153.1 RDD family protein [Planococcus sp. N028]WKA54426.1 RDD family protein [Planococcus sp. N022]